ncbi:MAG TPA: hypothetical protein VJY15_22425 [Candidatus Acidoferrum sp.]|nr:hypothetical protein [Candidatus Acidoferrum sp.]
MVQANQLEMLDRLDVSARVSRKMLKKMRFGINPEQFACVCLIIIATARTDAFFGY